MISHEELLETLTYNKESGHFIWPKGFHYEGRRAGSVQPYGDRSVKIRGHNVISEHRLVWFYVHGEMPEVGTIKHINGDRSDNRMSNLTVKEKRPEKDYTGLSHIRKKLEAIEMAMEHTQLQFSRLQLKSDQLKLEIVEFEKEDDVSFF